MATIPTPRSYHQILSDMINTFLGRIGLKGLKVGGPALSILEAAAQSDIRNTQDIFNLLDADSIDRATGSALDRLAASENLTRRGAIAAVGRVRFGDSRYTKISTLLDPGSPAPTIGATSFTVTDASAFTPGPGNAQTIYIGRGTTNYEGPLTIITKAGNTLFLSGATPITKYHNPGESVVLGQGGNRSIPAGTTVTTSNRFSGGVISYTTLEPVTIEDGEINSIETECVCVTPGTQGNIPKAAIGLFSTAPFTGATVTNDLPIVNGQSVESDIELRDRIKYFKQSRSKGTPTALIANSLGVSSASEHKTVTSASIINGIDTIPTTLYIDDGNGYEESFAGIAMERLTSSAQGGEQIFQLIGGIPIVKAFAETSLIEPYALSNGTTLAVRVGDVLTEHTFDTAEFTNIGAATAEEVVSAINGNANLNFSARTSDSRTRVVIFAKAESSNELEVITPESNDANTYLGFPTGINYDLLLYKNDQLLYEDGRLASLRSAPQSEWTSISSGATLVLGIDGVAPITVTFNDADFIAANTAYTTVSASNSLESWATVFNYKIPGTNIRVEKDYLVISSDLGRDSLAALEITGGTLVTSLMWSSDIGLSTNGQDSDYVFNRNTGQLRLNTALSASDELSAGSLYTRAYLQSTQHSTQTITLSDSATIWVSVDGAARVLPVDFTGRTISTTYAAGILTYTFSGAAFLVTAGVLRGDYLIVWDSALNTHGVFRVGEVAANALELTLTDTIQDFTADVAATMINAGLIIARSGSSIQQIRLIEGNNRTLDSIVTEINGMATGFTASVFHSKYLRLTTNDYTPNGDIFIVGFDTAAQALGFTDDVLVSNNVAQVGYVNAAPTINTPWFESTTAIGTKNIQTQDNESITYTTTPNELASDAGGVVKFLASNISSTPLIGGLGVNYNKEFQIKKRTTATTHYLRHPATNFQSTANVGGLVRAANVVTATTNAAHKFVVGDIIWVGPNTVVDANFPANAFVIVSVPSATSFTYKSTGANAASTQIYNIWLSENFFPSVTYADQTIKLQPLSISPNDNLNVIVNDDPNQNFNIPLYRNLGIGAYGGTTLTVIDNDNGGVGLDIAFGADFNFNDFAVYMKARGLIDKPAGDGIFYRYSRYGSEGESVRVIYEAPNAPDSDLTVYNDFDSNGIPQTVISLPTGPAKGISIDDGTWFTVTAAAPDCTFAYRTIVTDPGGVGALSRTGSTVTFDTATATPPGALPGIIPGSVIYLITGTVNFPTGPKIITNVAGNTYTYIESGPNPVTDAVGLTISGAANTPDFLPVTALDIVNIGNSASFDPGNKGTFQVVSRTATSFVVRDTTGIFVTETGFLPNASDLTFYPIDAANATVSNIASTINADFSQYLTGVIVGAGIGAVDKIYRYDNTYSVSLDDGINYINELSSNTLQFKDHTIINGSLNYDTANENIRIVPVTTQSLINWLESPAISGIFNSTEINHYRNGKTLQFNTLGIGKPASIQITGGTGNNTSASVIGASSFLSANLIKTVIDTDQANNFTGDRTIVLKSSQLNTLINNWTNATNIEITGGGTLATISVAGAFRVQAANLAPVPGNISITVTKIGDYAHYCIFNVVQNIIESNKWIEIRDTTGLLDPLNVGIFRCVASVGNSTDKQEFIVYNPNAVDQVTSIAIVNPNDVKFTWWESRSLMPGDTLVINSDALGVSNRGEWTILDTSPFLTATTLTVSGMTNIAATAIADKTKVYGKEGQTDQIWGLLKHAHLDSDNNAQTNLVIQHRDAGTDGVYNKTTQSNGYYVQALDKLGFDNALHSGRDAYSYNTGLINETAKVLYGDPSNPTVYPGVIAAGTNVNINGPLIRGIELTLEVRLRTGFSDSETIPLIQNAVAATINATKLGQDVDLSLVIAAARGINGVASVVATSPLLTNATDIISVQDNEKAMVLDVENDITVNILGT